MFNSTVTILGSLFILLGSLLPDIDTPYSKLGKLNPLAWFGLTKHRGFTHTIIAMLIFSVAAGYFFGAAAGIGLGIGYFGHLFLDSLNPTGIMWAYPVKKKYYRLANIKTSWH